jgi:hypothetical protein
MAQSLSKTAKVCEHKKDTTKDQKGWHITKPGTGEILHNIHANGKSVTFAGLEWGGVFAYQWTNGTVNVIPFFNKQCAVDTAKAYTLLTGEAVKVVTVDLE